MFNIIFLYNICKYNIIYSGNMLKWFITKSHNIWNGTQNIVVQKINVDANPGFKSASASSGKDAEADCKQPIMMHCLDNLPFTLKA